MFVDLDLKTVIWHGAEKDLSPDHFVLKYFLQALSTRPPQMSNPPLKTSSVHYPSTLSEGKKTEAESLLQRPFPDPIYLQIDLI